MEAALSFLGLGTQPPTPSWGGMLAKAREQIFYNALDIDFSRAWRFSPPY